MYRSIGYASSVDESLFGDSASTALTKTRRGKQSTERAVAPSTAVISASELRRIKNEAVIKTDAELAAERELAEKMKEEREKLSKERKIRMRELEKRSVQLAKKSDVELAEIAKKQAIRSLAEKKLNNNSDVVKLLNSMAQRAIAFTIRDKQLEEKKRLEQVEKEFDERMDMAIEVDRLKDIQRREEEEKNRRSKRSEDRKVIIEQIENRERMRMLQMEAREQENIAMRNLMKKYAEEDEIAAKKHQEEVERSRLAVLKANADAIERKKLAKEAAKKEVEDILLYQAMKDAELAKREEDEAAINKAKKERQAKLLAQQEKAQNNQGKMDELRARRAAEEKERAERKKEKADALKRRQEMKELLDSRAKQAADKLERQKLAKQQADEMILMDLEYTRKMDEREAAERRMKAERAQEHKVKLQQQIEDRARFRKSAPLDDETSNIRQELVKEEATLTAIRDQMVRDMIDQGVNPRYLSEMRNINIGKILKR